MPINPEGRTIQGLSTFITLIVLNVVYIITCLPIVTIGAATAALDEVMIRFSDEESGRPLRDFFPAFARNFARGTAVWFALGVPAALLALGAVFWSVDTSAIGMAAMILSAVFAVYVVVALLYAFALVATHRASVGRTLKNALLLPLAEPVRSLGVLLIPGVLFALAVIMQPFVVVILTIGFSVGAYASAFLFRSVFRRRGDGSGPAGQS